MVRATSIRDLEIARNKRDYAKDAYRPSSICRVLTKAALTTVFASGIYILDRCFNGNFLNNPELYTMDKVAVYTAAVSGLVGGLGSMRRMDERSAEKKLFDAEKNLDNLMKEYYEQETMDNLDFAERFHDRHPR